MNGRLESPRQLAVGMVVGVLLVWGLTSGLGFWLAPLLVALAWSLAVRSTRWQYIGGLLVAAAGYGLALIIAAAYAPLGRGANVVAAIMGFGHNGLIVWGFTFLLALLLGLAGAWVGHALGLFLVKRDPAKTSAL